MAKTKTQEKKFKAPDNARINFPFPYKGVILSPGEPVPDLSEEDYNRLVKTDRINLIGEDTGNIPGGKEWYAEDFQITFPKHKSSQEIIKTLRSLNLSKASLGRLYAWAVGQFATADAPGLQAFLRTIDYMLENYERFELNKKRITLQ